MIGRRSLLGLSLLSALAVMAPPSGEAHAGAAPPPPEVPPYPGPLERDRAPDPDALSRARAKRLRRAALRLGAAS